METQEAITEVNQEEWREIPGYEGLYEASSLGRIRSLDRVVKTITGQRKYKGRILYVWTDKNGYRLTRLSRGGKLTTYSVHRLVWVAFNGPIPEGMHIDHLNNLPGDNRLKNLQVITPKENTARQKLFGTSKADRVANGTDHETRKTHCNNGHDHFEENNLPSHAKRGWRSCLICSRARGYLHRNPDLPGSMEWTVYDYHLERFLLDLESAEKV